MADDLSAPLGRKRAAKAVRAPALNLKLTEMPLARIAFGVIALIVAGVGARVLLVNDPMGGRPVTEIDVNGSHNANSIASTVGTSDMATITADPETPVNVPGVTIVGDDVPDGAPMALGPETANADGGGIARGRHR